MRHRNRTVRPALCLLAALSTAHAATHTVKVGADGALFDPETLEARVGDIITYSFYSGNHSVIQTTLDNPCRPLGGGISSGFVPTEGGEVSPVTWRVVVNETDPVYVYSGEGNSCRKGMVQIINPPSGGSGTLQAFKTAIGNATTTVPGRNEPVGGQRILKIDVGKDDQARFEPSDVRDQIPGTILQFHFYPQNYSVVQASYADPCHPLKGGFSSGFIPIDSPSAGIDFSVALNSTNPVYFYDAQPEGSRCQGGMVGSINAPLSGQTHDSFVTRARSASGSTIPTYAPLGGTLTANSSVIPSLSGAVLHISTINSTLLSEVPKPDDIDPSILRKAGGGPAKINFGDKISDATAEDLQLLMYADNILLQTLLDGTTRLAGGGEWEGVFPSSIRSMLEVVAAQSYVHRSMSSYPLQHFDKGVPLPCAYDLPLGSVDDFVSTVLALVYVEIGLYGDFLPRMAAGEVWMLPALAGALGVKTRAAGLLDMMQSHGPGAASGEAILPPGLAYSYLSRYVSFCPDEDTVSTGLEEKFKKLPRLGISAKGTTPDGGRVTSVGVDFDGKGKGKGKGEGKYVAWIGSYGDVRFSDLGDGGVAEVPSEMYGLLWAVVTEKRDVGVDELVDVAVTGPEALWVAQP
ncbi:uncharacterized protein DNG_01445 [Cephalotrichum gorgonifer]|uniref:Uncharacterized protein n=1 Tax=Cephalotrichum gorgonifer TaxID=2041049 RepID=A0AAE8MT85_9PEZI|nr:uncharacterized protein DNG_01445 [Cephalotrichum gorgonifer]